MSEKEKCENCTCQDGNCKNSDQECCGGNCGCKTPGNFYIVKEDMICPVTKEHCDDECCPVGAYCNMASDVDLDPGISEKFSPVSKENLFHFSCKKCEKWWSIGDFDEHLPDENPAFFLYCPWCGVQQVFKI